MSHELISRSPDLKHLRDEGFEVEVRAGHLLIHSVPYVNARREVARGVLVSDLTLAGNITTRPGTHVAYFIGDHPCTKDGAEIVQIKHATGIQQLARGLSVNYSFSNKPPNGYANYHEKMTTYVDILSSAARALDPKADARTFKVIESGPDASVFRYLDTASSRAGITAISERVHGQRVAIVGLGGTGSYILDFVAKAPVLEIHLFDDDVFLQHNAFRAPGAPSLQELKEQEFKVDHFLKVYGRMHRGIVAHRERITEVNVHLLGSYDFVFVCVDSGIARKLIAQTLMARGIPFVDVGMGVEVTDSQELWAMCRATAGTRGKSDHLERRLPTADTDEVNLYAQNIQIADLNALNAVLAVIKWKKISGIYQDIDHDHHSTYCTNLHLLTSEERLDEA
jgi:hypothetical protein